MNTLYIIGKSGNVIFNHPVSRNNLLEPVEPGTKRDQNVAMSKRAVRIMFRCGHISTAHLKPHFPTSFLPPHSLTRSCHP